MTTTELSKKAILKRLWQRKYPLLRRNETVFFSLLQSLSSQYSKYAVTSVYVKSKAITEECVHMFCARLTEVPHNDTTWQNVIF
jgi:hypothetical protein